MAVGHVRDDAKRLGGTLCECSPHDIVAMLVALHDEVRVISEDRRPI
jgi:hypothetical protein